MIGKSLNNFGALFVAIGLLTIITPMGGVLVLLGIAMLLTKLAVSLSVHTARGMSRVAEEATVALRGRHPLRVAAHPRMWHLPTLRHSVHPTG